MKRVHFVYDEDIEGKVRPQNLPKKIPQLKKPTRQLPTAKKFIGIDLSYTGTGVAVISNLPRKAEGQAKEHITHLITSNKKQSIEERILYITEQIFATLDVSAKNGILLIAMEGLAFGAKGNAILDLGGLHYFVRIALKEAMLEYIIVSPQTLKKFTTGRGNSKKEVMIKECYKRWGVDFNDNNLCDAFCLAKYAKDYYHDKNNSVK